MGVCGRAFLQGVIRGSGFFGAIIPLSAGALRPLRLRALEGDRGYGGGAAASKKTRGLEGTSSYVHSYLTGGSQSRGHAWGKGAEAVWPLPGQAVPSCLRTCQKGECVTPTGLENVHE